MKLIKTIFCAVRREVLLVLGLIGIMAASTLPARAAAGTAGVVYSIISPQPVLYPLTNSPGVWLTNGLTATNMICITNGYTVLSSNATYIVQSQPFQIWPGRGFCLNASFVDATALNETATLNFRTATVHVAPWGGSTLVTNWDTTGLIPILLTANGTTTVFMHTNVLATASASEVDNVQLVQLYSIVMSANDSVMDLDPTNSFISVFPALVQRPQ
jgi:hypothetical protein